MELEREEGNLSSLELMNREKVSKVQDAFQRMHGKLQRHHYTSHSVLTRSGLGRRGMTVGSVSGLRYEGKEGGLRQRRKRAAAQEEERRDRAAGLQIHQTLGGSATVSPMSVNFGVAYERLTMLSLLNLALQSFPSS